MGIVAAVSGFLTTHGGFILESAQFGDASTGRFFMRTHFEAAESLNDAFQPIAKQFQMEWNIADTSEKMRVLLMVSREGHCLTDLLYRYSAGMLPIEIPAVISNHKNLAGSVQQYGIPFLYLPVTNDTKEMQEKQIIKVIEEHKIEAIALARYMQVLSDGFCRKFRGKAINIHHSFLPGFKGAKPYLQAYERGVKIIGATAHYITPELDEGPIIEQEVIRVDHTNSPEELRLLGQDIERQVLARALSYHANRRVLLNGNKTVVFR